jgi:CxxC-x17-CxxC domain-containing protein
MGDFKRNKSAGGRGGRSFGGGKPFGRSGFGRNDRGDDRPHQMHKTICSDCGASCEVPFKPTGTKPVYCRECFEKNGEGKSAPRKNDFRRDNRDNRRESFKEPRKDNSNGQLEMINSKLDKILKLLSEDTED